jgi:hypothetical protein
LAAEVAVAQSWPFSLCQQFNRGYKAYHFQFSQHLHRLMMRFIASSHQTVLRCATPPSRKKVIAIGTSLLLVYRFVIGPDG